MAGLRRIGARPAIRKVKVRCRERRVCGWSGERKDPGPTGDVADQSCPWCLRRSVELVGRTNPTRQEA